MNAGLGFEITVGVLPLDGEGDAFEAGFLAGLVFEDLMAVASAIGPAEIHAQQDLCPILRLGAAGARMEANDRVSLVVGPAENLL